MTLTQRLKRRIALTLFRLSQTQTLAEYYVQWGHALPFGIGGEMRQLLNPYSSYWGDERLPRKLYNLFWCLLNPTIYGQRHAYLDGEWYETSLNRLLKTELDADDIFIDIGANIGIYALLAAKLIGTTGHVIAFEANPSTFQLLKGHLDINLVTNATVHQVALGAENGTITLQNVAAGNGVASGVVKKDNWGDETCDVAMKRADDFLADISSTAKGICKVDVEGMEYEVIRGMSQFIETHPNIMFVIEVNPNWIAKTGYSASDLHAAFAKQGFTAYRIDTPNQQWERLTGAIDVKQYLALFQREND